MKSSIPPLNEARALAREKRIPGPTFNQTTDYDMFELHNINRNYRPDSQLAESMRKYGFLPWFAIGAMRLPNEKLQILFGHHRFDEAMRQGLPIWYIEYTPPFEVSPAIFEGNSHVIWNTADFVGAYSKDGNGHYILLSEFATRHGLNMNSAASLVGGETAGSGNKGRQIKNGKFKASDMKHANAVVTITDICHELGIGFARTTAFVRAVSLALRIPEFDKNLFISRLRTYPALMTRRGPAAEYLEEIEKVYNRATKNRVAVAFRAKEVSTERQRTFGKSSEKQD